MTTSDEPTGTLAERLAALDDQADAEAAAARAEALKAYRALLARADRPKRGDAEALKKCLATLGKSAGNFQNDLGVLGEARDLAAKAARTPEIEHQRRAVQEAFDAAGKAAAAAEKRRHDAWYEKDALASDLRHAREAGERLARLKARRRDLFGDGE